MRTVFNPSPMLSGAQIKAFPWDCVDILVVNEGEAADLIHHLHDPEMGRIEPASGVNHQYLRELRRLDGRFSETHIIMTLGSHGVCASRRMGGEELRVGAGEVRGGVVDTTGAGDCFTVRPSATARASTDTFYPQGYLAALLSYHDNSEIGTRLEAILQVCCAASAMCVENEGAAESVPSLADVRERLGRR